MGQKPQEIQARCFQYALASIRLYRSICRSNDAVGRILGKQYLRSATSIGAMVAEAVSAESRPDFVHKYSVAQKEARESLYWLKLLLESGVVNHHDVTALLRETDELVSIITTIIVRTKRNSP